MPLFDTHAHLDDEQFDGLRDQLIDRAAAAGVAGILAVGTTAASSRATVALAEQYDCVFAAVGIQPNYCAEAADDDWSQIEHLAARPRVVAIGETGLDRYWDYTPFDVQQDYFDRHLRLAQTRNLPVVIHMRDSGEEILEMLEAAAARGPLKGVMHSFTGDWPLAQRCLALGLYISFAGMVTYKKSDELRQVAACVPDERLLIETDSPYLSPHPRRGQRPNEPSLLVHTAECLAHLRQVDVAQLAQLTTRNALAMLQLPGAATTSNGSVTLNHQIRTRARIQGTWTMVKTASTMLPLDTTAPDFSLLNVDGKTVQLSDFQGSQGLLVIFMCNHCPFVKHLAQGLAEFARDYQARGLSVVAINSNDVENYPQDSPEQMVHEVEARGYTFPYLYDEDQSVAQAYGAACTPDFYLFDSHFKLVYRGQFDASRPDSGIPVTGEDLRRAADALLAGKAVSPDQKPSIGCNIKWKAGNEPQYFKN